MENAPSTITQALGMMCQKNTPEADKWQLLAVVLYNYGVAMGIDVEEPIDYGIAMGGDNY